MDIRRRFRRTLASLLACVMVLAPVTSVAAQISSGTNQPAVLEEDSTKALETGKDTSLDAEKTESGEVEKATASNAKKAKLLNEGESDTIYWDISSDGTLTLSPSEIEHTGSYYGSYPATREFDYRNTPRWSDYPNDVNKVVVLDTIAPTSLACYFEGLKNVTQMDLSGLDTSNATSLERMFMDCQAMESFDLSELDTSNVTNITSMFSRCTALKRVTLGFDTSNVTTTERMFYQCTSLTSVDLSGLDLSSNENMKYMFSGCTGLTTVNLSNVNTSKVTEMISLFSGCSSLTSLDLSSFDTSNVTDLSIMFQGCSGLTVLDLSSFDTSKVTLMNYMFKNCTNLETIKVSKLWTIAAVPTDKRYYDTFYECRSLVGEKGTRYRGTSLVYAIIDGGTENPGYLTGVYTDLGFDMNGHGSAVPGQTLLLYDKATEPVPAPTEAFYTFGGWYEEPECINEWDFETDTVKGSTTLYAGWTINNHNVSYAYTGTVPTEAPAAPSVTSRDYNSAVTVEEAPTLAGYTFSGWSTTDVTVTSGSFTMPDNAVAFTGSWSAKTDTAYTVEHYKQNIDDDGYTKVEDDTESKTGTTGTDTAAVAKSYAGFRAKAITQAAIKGDGSTVVKVYYDRNTFKIIWKDEDRTTLGEETYRFGKMPSFPSPTKAATAEYSYTFNEWTPMLIPADANATYTASYTATKRSYNVTFNMQGIGTAPESQTVLYGDKVTSPSAVAVTGYLFGGWYKEASCINAWNFAADTVAGDTTIYAKWTALYLVSFNMNGHGTQTGSVPVANGNTFTRPTDPTETGFTFGGWYKDASCTSVWDFTTDTVTGNTTLYAKWTANSHNVTYSYTGTVPAGVAATPAASSKDFGTIVSVETAPTLAGYTFSGWTTTDVTVTTGRFAMPDSDVAFTGTWTANPDTSFTVELKKQNIADDGYTTFSYMMNAGTTDTMTNVTPPAIEGFTAKPVTQESIKGDGSTTVMVYYDRNLYTITWKNGDDVLETDTGVRYEATPSYDGATPVKPEDEDYTYTFKGWSPNVVAVSADATYSAQFDATAKPTPPTPPTPSDEEEEEIVTVTYSRFWEINASGSWVVRNSRGQLVTSAWLCDDAIASNGRNTWYLIGSDGQMVTAGLVRDASGNYYSLETEHNGFFGMMRFKNGYYNVGGQSIYIEFEQTHGGSFGAIRNAEAIARLRDIYGVTDFSIGNESCTYTASF
ncbi:MAG: InlB B-repeat-containing protein [Eubacteriales bacterium]|nr:InlB B-repeat-containing protein [Eubacteriales bacterium]